MRIKKNFHDGCESYTCELQERVEDVFLRTSQIMEIKMLLAIIKMEVVGLQTLFLTEEEQKERSEVFSSFDAKMQENVFNILKNLESYQLKDWQDLSY